MYIAELLVSHILTRQHLLIGDLRFCVFLQEILCRWKSKKEECCVTIWCGVKVSCNGEVTCELVWIRDLLTALDFTLECPMRLHCDNHTLVHIAENSIFHKRTKYI